MTRSNAGLSNFWSRFLWLSLAIGVGLMLWIWSSYASNNRSEQPNLLPFIETQVSQLRTKIKPLLEMDAMLPRIRSDDWLARKDVEHNGQTLGEYLQSHREPLADTIKELRVLPILINGRSISAQHEGLVEASTDFLTRYFQMNVSLMESKNIYEVPTDATRLKADGTFQVNSVYLLKRLQAARKPMDPVTIAFVEEDLWPGNDWNYVFGQASTTSRVGVWSTSRLKEQSKSKSESTISLRRTLHIAAHETGHMLGFSHCTAFQCCMNGCNNRDELDRQPLEYCSECLSKLWWTCKIDPNKRAKELLDFSISRGLKEDADFWRKQAQLLTPTD